MRRLDDMAVFERIIREGSLSAAARALHMPKSTVSDRLARLETRLGIQLIERTTRRLNPTDAGLDYYERCRRIVELADEAEAELSSERDMPRGLLRIVAQPEVSTVLQPALIDANTRWTELRIDVHLRGGPVDLIEEGFDLGLRLGQGTRVLSMRGDTGVRERTLRSSPMVCVTSPGYLAQHGDPSRVSALAKHRCIGQQLDERWAFRGPDESVDVRPTLAVDSFALTLAAALAGLGIARLPAFTCRDEIDSGRLESLFSGRVVDGDPLVVQLPPRRPSRVRAFLRLLEDQ